MAPARHLLGMQHQHGIFLQTKGMRRHSQHRQGSVAVQVGMKFSAALISAVL
jgi:hypothetical protein